MRVRAVARILCFLALDGSSMAKKWISATLLGLLASSLAHAQGGTTVSPEPTSSQAVACTPDCVRINATRAVAACGPGIEAQAPGDFEWLQRPYGTIFQQADTPDEPSSPVVKYRGDSIRFLDAREKWVRVVYECSFDTKAERVTIIRVRPGVLGKASAIPAARGTQASAPGPRPAASAASPQPPAAPAAPQSSSVNLRRIGEPSAVAVNQIPPGAKPPQAPAPAPTPAQR